MAIIYSYPKNTDILVDDTIIGTSTKIVNGKRRNVTKNFEVGAVATFFNNNSSIAIAGQNNFFFQDKIAPGRKPGSISFIMGNGAGTSFNSITTLRISKYATSGNVIIDFINTLVNEAIIIAQCDDLNNFGIYKFNAITPVVGEPNFFDITIEAVNANGTILEDKFYSIAVYPGFVNPDMGNGSGIDKTSQLINDGSDGTSTYVETDELGTTAFSNDYNDLDNLPTIPDFTSYNLEELHNVTETNYTTPIDTDSLLTFDVTTSLWERLSWSNIKSNLKTYFDTLYQSVLGFTPENVDNKSTSTLLGTSDTLYPTQNAVKVYADTKVDKVTSSGVERVYTINSDGSQGVKNMSDFGTVKTIIKDVNFSSNLTGTTSPILGKSYTIPAGTVKTGDIVRITVRFGNIGGDYGSVSVRATIGSNNSFSNIILSSTTTFEQFMQATLQLQVINSIDNTGFRNIAVPGNLDEGYTRGYGTLTNVDWNQNQILNFYAVNSVSGRISIIRMVEVLIS